MNTHRIYLDPGYVEFIQDKIYSDRCRLQYNNFHPLSTASKLKGHVKLMQWVKIAHAFIQSVRSVPCYQGYFIDTINPGRDNLYTADQICRMVEFLIDNIFVKFGGCLFRQVIGIPVGTNCAFFLADLLLYSYESEFLDNMIRGGHRKLARSFNLCYRYTDDLIVFNNKKFGDYVK